MHFSFPIPHFKFHDNNLTTRGCFRPARRAVLIPYQISWREGDQTACLLVARHLRHFAQAVNWSMEEEPDLERREGKTRARETMARIRLAACMQVQCTPPPPDQQPTANNDAVSVADGNKKPAWISRPLPVSRFAVKERTYRLSLCNRV